MKYVDEMALLDHILEGKALPDHMARPRAGEKVPKLRGKPGQSYLQSRDFNDKIAEEAAKRLKSSPLIAICYHHKCKCGNTWTSFGFFARSVELAIEREGKARTIKRLDTDPGQEPLARIEWQDSEEIACNVCITARYNASRK
jgi:hypothetical protein